MVISASQNFPIPELNIAHLLFRVHVHGQHTSPPPSVSPHFVSYHYVRYGHDAPARKNRGVALHATAVTPCVRELGQGGSDPAIRMHNADEPLGVVHGASFSIILGGPEEILNDLVYEAQLHQVARLFRLRGQDLQALRIGRWIMESTAIGWYAFPVQAGLARGLDGRELQARGPLGPAALFAWLVTEQQFPALVHASEVEVGPMQHVLEQPGELITPVQKQRDKLDEPLLVHRNTGHLDFHNGQHCGVDDLTVEVV